MKPRYNFVSHWNISAERTRVGEALLASEDWVKWWQGLEDVEVITEKHGVGSVYHCTWRSASGYRLRSRIEITDYRPAEYIGFISSGELEGDGSFALRDKGGATAIKISWNVATTKRWMNLIAPLLRPLFIYNHHCLMADGERGLEWYMSRPKSKN